MVAFNKPSNVLVLGMSYASVKEQLKKEGVSWDVMIHKDEEPSVAQAVELVRRNVLTEMDGRDLARCISMEKVCNTKAYTVSQESGAEYADNHLSGNFNRRTVLREIKRKWDKDTKMIFRQIILDYFWIPQGTWVMQHWGRNFFLHTLPGFVKEGMLEFESNLSRLPRNNPANINVGAVFLPFCFHCVKMILSCSKELSQYYTVSFVYKSELEEHALWAGTSKIDPATMQEWLGKQLNQEDIYCTFSPQDVKGCLDDGVVTKDDVVNVLKRIEDFGDVRMIRLKPLLKHDPKRRKARLCRQHVQENMIGVDIGGFIGLKDPKDIKNGYFDLESGESSTAEESSEPSEKEEDSEDARPSMQVTKARKKRVAVPVVSSSDDENTGGKKKRRRRTKSIPVEEDERQVTFLNLCPEIHPTEAKYCHVEIESSPLPSSSLAENEGHRFDILLSAINMSMEPELSKDPDFNGTGQARDGVTKECVDESVADGQNRDPVEQASECAVKRDCTHSQLSKDPGVEEAREETCDDTCSNLGASGKNEIPGGEACAKRHRWQQPIEASCVGTVLEAETRDLVPSRDGMGDRVEVVEALEDDALEENPGDKRRQRKSKKKKGKRATENSQHVRRRKAQGEISSGAATAAWTGGSESNHNGAAESVDDTSSLDVVRSEQCLPRRPVKKRKVRQNTRQEDIVLEDRSERTEHPLVNPMGQHVLPEQCSFGGAGFHLSNEDQFYRLQVPGRSPIEMELLRQDLIIRNGRMLLAHLLHPDPNMYTVIASLAEEGFARGIDASIRSNFSPDMTIADLTRYLLEKVGHGMWLDTLGSRSRPLDAVVPHRVVISYGPDRATLVRFKNSPNPNHGEISVGLRLLGHGSILSPLDNVMMHLSPYGNSQSRVELVTECLRWQNNATPDKAIDCFSSLEPVRAW